MKREEREEGGRKEAGRKLVRDPGKTTSPTITAPREKYVKYWLHFIITWELGRLSYPIHSSSPSSRTLQATIQPSPSSPPSSRSLSFPSAFLPIRTFPSPARRQETHASMFVFLCVYTRISEEEIVVGTAPLLPFLAFLRRFTVRACRMELKYLASKKVFFFF